MLEQTLSIIKPDAIQRNLTEQINDRLKNTGMKIITQKKLTLTLSLAQEFYEEHRERSFYNDLCEYMTSGPVIIQVLEGENAIMCNRKIMGVTNPDDAADGTIRKDFGESLRANSIHGSDSTKSALREISFFFNDSEL